MTTMEAAMSAQEKQAALAQRVTELEKENERLKNWNAEREQYALVELRSGFFAYCRKPEVETFEPVHHLCANCFTKHEKSILQVEMQGHARGYRCLRCASKVWG